MKLNISRFVMRFLFLASVMTMPFGFLCPPNEDPGDNTPPDVTDPDDSGQDTPDDTESPAPTVVRAVALDGTTVAITFSQPMEDDADQVGFYRITPSLRVLSASLNEDKTIVTLTTGPQEDVEYNLNIGDLLSAEGKLIDAAKRVVVFFGIAENDTTAPRVVGAEATSFTNVLVSFSEPVGPEAETTSNYRITIAGAKDPEKAKLVISGAKLTENATEVMLTTLPQAGQEYLLVVNGIEDLSGNVIDEELNEATFDGIPAPDNDLPRVVGAISTGNTSVMVTFSEIMGSSAAKPGNYLIGTSNLVPEAGGLVVTDADFVSGDHTAVILTTLSQAQVQYDVTAVNVKDQSGNPLGPRQLTPGGGVIDPTTATFWGTGPSTAGGGGAGLIDTDGDGLPDDVEQRGWVVTVVRADGSSFQRDVSSDPLAVDTDGDGLDDLQENRRASDPRNKDTDADLIKDSDEINIYFASPNHQDTDGDGLNDSSELFTFKTSPIREDTDGDNFTDREEVLLINRNPRIADLPRPQVDVGDMAIRLDTRFSYTDTQGQSRTTEKSTSTSITESHSRTMAFSDSTTNTNTVEASTEIGVENTYGLSDISSKFSFSASAGYSYSNEKTLTVSRESTEEAQQAYQESLSIAETVDETKSVTREVVGASMDVVVTIGNVSDTAFSMTNLELTALQQDPRNKKRFLPVATLIPASTLSTGVIPEYTTGPFIPERGPFIFSSREIFPSLAEDLMRNPRGLIFKVANFDVTDEFGRNLAFTSQTVNDRTAGLTVDYGNGSVDRFRIATAGSFNSDNSVYTGGFDAKGRERGLPMGFVLQEILELEKNGEPDAIRVGPDGCAQTFASGDDIQVVTPVCPAVVPGGVIVTAGPNGRVESLPRGDDIRVGSAVIDGGDGCAHTVASGDDLTVVQGACSSGGQEGIVILAGPNGVLDSTARADDEVAVVSGYATTLVTQCDADTVDAIFETLVVTADSVAVGDDVQETPFGMEVNGGTIIISAGPNGVLDSVPAGNDVITPDNLTIVEPIRIADTLATGDDVQVIPQGQPVTAGLVIITAGPNGTIDTTPLGNDALTGPGFACASGLACPGGTCRQVEVLSRFKGVENNLDESRFWILFTDADFNLGADFDDIVLQSSDTFTLAYVQDKDEDQLFAREEYLYGSSDSRINTDGCPDPGDPAGTGFICNDPSCADFDTDCLSDYEEVRSGWEVAVEGRSTYYAYSDPARADSDADGVLDGEEWLYGTDALKADTDGDGISDGDEIYGFTIFKKDRTTVIRHVDPYQSVAIADGGDGVVSTFLSGDDVIVNNSPAAAGDVIIVPGVNGILESIPAGDDTIIPTQVIMDGGNGIVNTTPAGDDTLAQGAGSMLITVNFESFNAGNDDCDADDAVVGSCDNNSTNNGDECSVNADCTGGIGGVCEGRCSAGSDNNGDACTVDGECTNGTCDYACDADSLNAGTACTDSGQCNPTPGACELPDRVCSNDNSVTCTTDGDCIGGTCVAMPNRMPAGEYTFRFEVTKPDGSGGTLVILDELLENLPINGGEGTVLLQVPTSFPLTQGESFTVRTTISEVDTGVDSAFEQNLPGNEMPADWVTTETLLFTDLTTNTKLTREVEGPATSCACCFDEDLFVYTIKVGGTVRQGGIVVRPGNNAKLNSTPGGDDVKATPHFKLFATNPLDADTDDDTLPDGLERKLGANPNDTLDRGRYLDTDRDGLTDGQEDDGWFIGYRNEGGALLCRNGDGNFIVVTDPELPPASCVIVTSDPLEPDTDLDGLPDALEMVVRSDPRDRDTDGDSLLDYDEFDAASDSSISFVEYRDFQDICDPAERCVYTPPGSDDPPSYGTSLIRVDTDADGISDADEVFGGWVVAPCNEVPYFVTSDPTEADKDLDGWNDDVEFTNRTDPNNADTDDDINSPGGGIDSQDPFPASCGKLITVTFNSWDVGDDDCDSATKGDGDFSYNLRVTRDGQTIRTFSASDVKIGSGDTKTLNLSSGSFALTPGQSFAVRIQMDEDDISSLDEPPTWISTKTYNYNTVSAGADAFENGPDCFSDDRVNITISVSGG